MIYNSDLYDENTAPKDWSDLWKKEEFRGKYDAPSSFGGGTTRAVLAGILVRYQDPMDNMAFPKKVGTKLGITLSTDIIKLKVRISMPTWQTEKLRSVLCGPAGCASREEQYKVLKLESLDLKSGFLI